MNIRIFPKKIEKNRKRKILPHLSSLRTAPTGPRRSHCLVGYRTLAESAQKRTPPLGGPSLPAAGAGCLRGGAPHRSRRLRTTPPNFYHFHIPVPTPNPFSHPHFPVSQQVPLQHSLSPPSVPFQPHSLAHFFKPLTCPNQTPISRLIALRPSRDIHLQTPARELARPVARCLTPITHFCHSHLVDTGILHLFGNVHRPCILASAKV